MPIGRQVTLTGGRVRRLPERRKGGCIQARKRKVRTGVASLHSASDQAPEPLEVCPSLSRESRESKDLRAQGCHPQTIPYRSPCPLGYGRSSGTPQLLILIFETMKTSIGRRIHVIGNSCSGKSTLGAKLAQRLDLEFVELDALNWEPGWVGLNERNPAELERRIRSATGGSHWVVAGSYSKFSKRIFWDRVQTVVWLDLPVPVLVWRMLRRSWRRWRTRQQLWGSNYERFWPQLMFWRKEDSLLWWIVTQQERKRREMREAASDPKWQHIDFVRLSSGSEIHEFLAEVER